MNGMAKKRKAAAAAEPKRVRPGAPIQAFVDPEIRGAMDDFIRDYNEQNEHKASVTSTLEAALKMYLSAKGHWPRKAANQG
ncbi:MAG: hypothetical protein U0804_17140 [Gemmataceae bacterium]